MDALLGGYGSDSSSSSNDRDVNPPLVSTTPLISTTNPSASFTSSGQRQQQRRGGKRLLSLGAILPPEIFDRLTRTSQENGDDDDDSSASVPSGDGMTIARYSKRDMQQKQSGGLTETAASDRLAGRLGGDKDLNMLLNELRSTPVTSNSAAVVKSTINSTAGSRKNNLGMAFMNYTSSSSTKIGGSGDKTVVVDVHVAPTLSAVATTIIPPPQFRRAIQSAPPNRVNNNASIDQPAVDDNDNDNRSDNSVNYIHNNNDSNKHISNNSINRPNPENNSGSGVMYKSRKQLREEEQSLRSGHIAFDNYSSEVYQPSPSEFAPTAHAAAIASKAARRIAGSLGGGGGGHSSIAIYDPKQGMEVSVLGVTGKHRSKHQINQLMASAISLEAHRASEAELARFGAGAGGKGNSRSDAKRKYGW